MSSPQTTSTGSSMCSLAESWIAFDSTEDLPAQPSKAGIYKAIRPAKSRQRPALPPSFLQLDGAATPWRTRVSDGFPDTESMAFGSLSLVAPDLPSTPISPTRSREMRFSTYFDSTTSLLAVEDVPTTPNAGPLLSREKPLTYGLVPWRTPTTDRTIRKGLRISSSSASTCPTKRKVAAQFRKKSETYYPIPSSFTDEDILHIRLPSPRPSHNFPASPSRSPAVKPKRNSETRMQGNLKIRAEDPKAKDAGTAIDGIFGIGKEESKAAQGGYAGLGIARDKKSWKATEDYVELLERGARSSIYNYNCRSPKSRRKSSASSLPKSPPLPSAQRKTRKPPPPPLNLGSVSSYSSMGSVKTAERLPLAKKPSAMNACAAAPQADTPGREGKPQNMAMRAILRSVRSLSNMRNGVKQQ